MRLASSFSEVWALGRPFSSNITDLYILPADMSNVFDDYNSLNLDDEEYLMLDMAVDHPLSCGALVYGSDAYATEYRVFPGVETNSACVSRVLEIGHQVSFL